MRSLKLLAAAAALATAMPALAAPTYTLTDIGDLAGGSNYSAAWGLNNLGQVVGQSSGASGMRAFVWANGTMTALPTLAGAGGFGTGARGINDAGQIVGNGVGFIGQQAVFRGIVWQDGVATSIGDLAGGPNYSEAYAINNSGQVAGTSYATSGQAAAIWQNGSLSALGDLPGGSSAGLGYAINADGQVAGQGGAATGTRAALYTQGQVTNLGDLPGGGDSSIARGINDAGHVVGQSSTVNAASQNVTHAFLWVNGVMTDLGDLAGGADGSFAYDINNAGRVVGYGLGSTGAEAAMWFGGEVFSLGSLVANLGGWQLTQASAINERGQIVGYGLLNGTTRAFLLTPDAFDDAVEVPEPAALGLFGLGFLGLALRRRRKG
ncbi:PEP-CTERM sorting domain-containing protein [Sphingoaurantiacus capsulatus]|uniref:PEP-CTERM sorting domain-containing protein n=1 Tax=Sphingoaurantiacus capsulatus TaxID=1771310 RepID=A0ABV7X7K8_9SPHN